METATPKLLTAGSETVLSERHTGDGGQLVSLHGR